jgi:hypothetical protein
MHPPPSPTSSRSVDAYVTPAVKIMYKQTLVDPITLDRIKSITKFDNKGKEIPEEAPNIVRSWTSDTQVFLKQARELETKYKRLIYQTKVPHTATTGPNETGGGPMSGHATQTRLAIVPPMASVFSSNCSA